MRVKRGRGGGWGCVCSSERGKLKRGGMTRKRGGHSEGGDITTARTDN